MCWKLRGNTPSIDPDSSLMRGDTWRFDLTFMNAPLLVLDAASPRCFAGVWRAGEWLACREPERPALEGLFGAVEESLAEAGLALADLGGFVHCEGPGSILGARLSAMAIRTWRALPAWSEVPAWAYGSLHFAAAARKAEGESSPASFCSEFRHGRWNLLRAEESAVRAVDADALAVVPAPLVYVRQRAMSKGLPAHAVEWSPDRRRHAPTLATPGLLRRVEEPAVFVAEEATFQKWSGARHRAPLSPPKP